MPTSQENVDFDEEIQRAVSDPDPAVSNLKITRVHFLLSEGLRKATGGAAAGANFHSWAIWGSRKAGVTIRQEDLDGAIQNASWVAGTVGAGAGLAVKFVVAPSKRSSVGLSLAALALGGFSGSAVGREIAAVSRREASAQILAGNRTVLEDIGTQTTRFLRTFENQHEPDEAALSAFLDGFRPGDTSIGGQGLLRAAFAQYYRARFSADLCEKHQALYFGNCLAVFHEHIRLQPNIVGSMPWIIRKCVTKRMMTFDVGRLRLAVSKRITGEQPHYPSTLADLCDPELIRLVSSFDADSDRVVTKNSESAVDWTKIDQRMRYIVRLFRMFHTNSEVCAAPYELEAMRKIAAADSRSNPTTYQMIISPT